MNRKESNKITFEAIMSKSDYCTCDSCHNIGKVIKINLPETKFFDGENLTTIAREYWLCDSCRTVLNYLLNNPDIELQEGKRMKLDTAATK